MNTSSGTSFRTNDEPAPRVCLGPGAPAGMPDFLARAGLDPVGYAHRHHAALFVDFMGARPSGVEVLSFDLGARDWRTARSNADLATDNWQAAATLIISHMLGLKPPLLGADSEMLAVIKSAMGVAANHVPVILSGEIGTGKYNLARLIHRASRCRGPLLTINCANLEDLDSASLLRSITGGNGADSRSASSAAAAQAMLFLDEIGELTDTAQLKLLQLLQAGERTPWVDPNNPRPSLRFLAATNRALPAMVESGDFRKDLYWRLNVFSLEIPPLRQRAGDVPMLARYLLRRANVRRSFTPMALKVLSGYSFPGNVLELENLVTRLALTPLAAANNLIDVPDIRRHLMIASATEGTQVTGWKTSREEARREMIFKTIAAAGGSRVEAARRLGITVRTLQYHITKAGLSKRRAPRVEIAQLDAVDTPESLMVDDSASQPLPKSYSVVRGG